MSISGTTTSPNNQNGTSSRRSRCPITSTGGELRSDRAISEPATANITPIDGKTMLSQPQPVTW